MPRADGRPTAQQKRDAKIAAANGGPTDTEKLNHQAIIRPDTVPDAHGEVAKPQSAGAKVTVACKLGIAYFDIQLCRKTEVFEQNMQGGRQVPTWERIGDVVRLRGTSYPRGTPPAGFPAPPEMASGAALNRGIDKAFWDEWVKQNEKNPVVMNGMVFAHESDDHVRGMAAETKGNLSGLDPVNPKKDARIPRSTRSDVTDVAVEDSRNRKTANEAA